MNFTSVKSNKYLSTILNSIFGLMFSLLRFVVRKNNSGKTVIVALHKLGDCVFTLEAIKRIINYQNEEVVIICFPETTEIFKIVLEKESFLEINHYDFYLSGRIASSKARSMLKNIKPKTIFDLTGSVTSASLIFNSSASQIIGTNESFYRSIYNKFVPLRTEPHVKDIYLDAIKPVINIEDKLSIHKPIEIEGGYIGIHPFAGWDAKEWNLRKFIILAENLSIRFPVKFVAPSNKLAKDVIQYLKGRGIEVVETFTTKELIEFIRSAFLFVGNDSGPIQIANLLGIPTFAIYGPTNPAFHKPSEGINEYFFTQIKCSPKSHEKVCFTNGGRNGCPAFECMSLIKVSEVYEALNFLLTELKITCKVL